MKPRILFLDHAAEPGGAELVLLDVASFFTPGALVLLFQDGPLRTRLEAKGVAVKIAKVRTSMLAARRGSGAAGTLRAMPGTLAQAAGVARLAHDFDLIYANSQKAFIVGAIAARVSKKPLVWHLHDLLTSGDFHPLLRKTAVTLANRCASLVLANSHATRTAFMEAGGRRALTEVVHPGIHPADFLACNPTAIASWRTNLCGNAPLVGIFGRLTIWKGQHVFLSALADLPGVHGMVVGDTLFENRDYADQLRRQAQHLGISERTHFLGHSDAIPTLMQAVDLVIHGSISPEPFGRVIVEGMLAERPVIATAAGGVPEIIADGVNGVLVPPGDTKALSTAMATLLANPQRRRLIARRGREDALRRFSLAASLEATERAITRMWKPCVPRTGQKASSP